MAKAKDQVANVAATEPVAIVPTAETPETAPRVVELQPLKAEAPAQPIEQPAVVQPVPKAKPSPAPKPTVVEPATLAVVATPVEPELKEFVCDMPADAKPPGVSVQRTVKAKDKYEAQEVYFKTLGIIETSHRPVIVEKVAGE